MCRLGRGGGGGAGDYGGGGGGSGYAASEVDAALVNGGAHRGDGSVSFTYRRPPNSAPVAVADGYSTLEDTPLTVAAPGVLGNDTDVDGNALTALLVSGPSHGESQARQDSVRGLLGYVNQTKDRDAPLVVCGDFNADPDSDEIRMVSGRTTAPVPGLSFYDAWGTAGPGDAGFTWSNANPWATELLWPNRRIDYIFSATPRRGGAGHPLEARLLGTHPVDGIHPSDHFALQADLRY